MATPTLELAPSYEEQNSFGESKTFLLPSGVSLELEKMLGTDDVVFAYWDVDYPVDKVAHYLANPFEDACLSSVKVQEVDRTVVQLEERGLDLIQRLTTPDLQGIVIESEDGETAEWHQGNEHGDKPYLAIQANSWERASILAKQIGANEVGELLPGLSASFLSSEKLQGLLTAKQERAKAICGKIGTGIITLFGSLALYKGLFEYNDWVVTSSGNVGIVYGISSFRQQSRRLILARETIQAIQNPNHLPETAPIPE